MISIDFPKNKIKTKSIAGKDFLFDRVRKKWIFITEEEWVRQHIVVYLTMELKYPLSYIAIEKEIILGELKKRFDVLVYNKEHEPWMLIECKSPEVALTDEAVMQILRYHLALPVEYLVVSNGAKTFAWQKIGGELQQLTCLPNFS